MTEHVIYKTIFGSRLFGTDMPESDTDYKGVFVPSHRQIVMGNYPSSINQNTGGKHQKNDADDVDLELYSIKEYMKLLEQGQTNAIDMLFSTKRDDPDLNPFWAELYDNRDKVLSRKSDSFVGYCIAQSNKYNFKIDRFQSLEIVVKEFLRAKENGCGKYPIGSFDLEFAFTGDPNCFIEEIVISPTSGKKLEHLSVCGKKVPVTHTIDQALAVYEKLYKEYGHRARNNDQDWKAVYHAIRIADECIELLETGKVTFPRPNAEYLKSIRRGEVPYDETSDKILELVAYIDEIDSTLQEEPNREWIQDFLYRVHSFYLNV